MASQYNRDRLMPWWRNWQTRMVEGHVLPGVEVRVLSRASYNKQRPLLSGFCLSICGHRPLDINY